MSTALERLDNHTANLMACSYDVVSNYQKAHTPHMMNISYYRVYRYMQDNDEKIPEKGKLYFKIKGLETYPKWNRKGNYIGKRSLKSIIDNNEMPAIALFADGKFIKWSNIEIVKNYDDMYLVITPPSFMTSLSNISLKILTIPFKVLYSENGPVSADNLDHLFIFDSNGLSTSANSVNNTYFSVSNIDFFFTEGTSFEGLDLVSSGLPYETILCKHNIIMFKNGLYYDPAKVDIYTGNIFSIDEGAKGEYSLSYKIFYDLRGNSVPNNIARTEYDPGELALNIASKLNGQPYPKYLDSLAQSFDIEYTEGKYPGLSYEEALATDMMKYNHSLMDDLYKEDSTLESITLKGSDILSKIDANSNFTIPRRRTKNKDNNVMVFVNGLFYQYYRRIKYMNNRFIMPTQGIIATDTVEFIFFKEIENTVVKGIIDVAQDRSFIMDDIFNENLKIFCATARPNIPFTYPTEGPQPVFEVAFTIQEPLPGERKIVFEDPFYYNKELMFCNSTQFRSISYISDEETIRFKLTDEFKTCNDPSKYMIFLNGRKLSQEDYRMALFGEEFPFVEQYVYLFKSINPGETIDIFYTPTHINEDWFIATGDTTSKLPLNGNIAITNNFGMNFSKHMFMIFINGRKVHNSNIVNLNASTMRILNTESIKNVSIMSCITADPKIASMFTAIGKSLWDKTTSDDMTYDETLNILGIPAVKITDTEGDIYATNGTSKTASMLELVRDGYSNSNVTSPSQVESFINALGEDSDCISFVVGPDGTSTMAAGDATREINLDIERSYFPEPDPVTPTPPPPEDPMYPL